MNGQASMKGRLTIRPADVRDVAEIVRLSRATGQTDADSGADQEYVDFLLRTATVKVVVDARSITAWGAVRRGALGALLTDLFVHPDQHGLGMGGALLRALWPDHTAPKRFTFSSQHASALPLYARAGLKPSWPLLYLSGRRAWLPSSTLHVERADAAGAADSQLATGNRSADYAFWTRAPSDQPLVVRDGQRIVAAAVVRGGNLVHLTCAEADTASALTTALRAAEADDLTVCLPGPHPSVISLLRAGFRVVDYDLAMSTPNLTLPVAWAYSPGLG